MKPRFKPLDRPEGEDIWFCHSTPTHEERPSSVFRKALSQVPDLNNGKDSSHLHKEQPKKYVKGAIHPNDTKYIRLAKAGGRKHLLAFVESPEKSRSPQPYPVPGWYSHYEENTEHDGSEVNCPERPDWMTHLENADETGKSPDYIPGQGIIAWDKMSAWKREEFERQMKLKTKSTYEQRKKKHEKQHKIVKPKSKVNIDDSSTKDGKLPNIKKSQFQGFRKLSGTELATQWYKKWYLIGKA